MKQRLPVVLSATALVVALLGVTPLGHAAHKAATKALVLTKIEKAKPRRGPRGPRGPRGLRGLTGAQGPAGAIGPAGAKGDKGDKGDPTYKQTILVSPVGTDLENGAVLRAALNSVTDASAAKRYLIKVEPGQYNVGADALVMKSFVDLEGSGSITRILGAVPVPGTLVAAPGVVLRSVSVQNDLPTPSSFSIAITNQGTNTFVLDHVDASASGGTTNVGLLMTNTAGRVLSSTLTGSGGSNAIGLMSQNSYPYVESTTVSASKGVVATNAIDVAGGITRVDWSILSSELPTHFVGTAVHVSSGSAEIGSSKIDGDVTPMAVKCAWSYTFDHRQLDKTCAVIP